MHGIEALNRQSSRNCGLERRGEVSAASRLTDVLREARAARGWEASAESGLAIHLLLKLPHAVLQFRDDESP